MGPIRIPEEAACLELLLKYETPEHIIRHSQMVWLVGRLLGKGLLRRQVSLDMALLRASCLLHDIGKYPCVLDGTRYHDIRGGEILGEEGFPEVGRIVAQHVVLQAPAADRVREEHVVFYADKRVVHDKIVSLDERFDYLCDTYGKTAGAVKQLMLMKDDTIRVEEKIFGHLDFRPDDVIGLLG